LDSSYGYNFSDRSSAGVNTKDNRVSAGLRHKLYESLVSSFDTHYFKNDASAFSQDSYGLSLDEAYVKKMGKIGRFSSGIGIKYAEEKRKAPDEIISVIDESHTLTNGIITFLDQAFVNTATVVVTDTAGPTTYTLAVDYQLFSTGERTQIQRLPGGSIANGSTVLVDYQVKASSFLKFNTLDENFRFRMDFLEDLIGVFYRLSREKHPRVQGEENTILQTLTDKVIGIDFHFRNLEIALEDEDYDSNLSPYKRLELKESFTFNPSSRSTLTLQSSQSKIRLINTYQVQKFFSYLSRYSLNLNRYSRFSLEAGYRQQSGSGVDLDDLTVGSGYELDLGSFQLDAKYDFKKQLYLGDRLVNHFYSTTVKRRF